jgi:uncharacterized protein YuzE
MKFNYYQDTDSLYIDLSEKTSVDSQEISPGVVLDFDADGHLVGIDIDHASQFVDLYRLEAESLPIKNLSLVAV